MAAAGVALPCRGAEMIAGPAAGIRQLMAVAGANAGPAAEAAPTGLGSVVAVAGVALPCGGTEVIAGPAVGIRRLMAAAGAKIDPEVAAEPAAEAAVTNAEPRMASLPAAAAESTGPMRTAAETALQEKGSETAAGPAVEAALGGLEQVVAAVGAAHPRIVPVTSMKPTTEAAVTDIPRSGMHQQRRMCGEWCVSDTCTGVAEGMSKHTEG